MILVIAGTQDARELVHILKQESFVIMASVVSGYGKSLLGLEKIEINDKPFDMAALIELIQNRCLKAIVDASHPYAANVSQNAIEACRIVGIPYIRYERQTADLANYAGLHPAPDYEIAARIAASLGKVIFLTTGSRHLKVFSNCIDKEEHTLIARVLPDPKVLQECFQWGFTPKTVIAMQGPFSHELNKSMFQQCGANVIVTKNSGTVGGTDTKIEAAFSLGLPVVVIGKPQLVYPALTDSYEGVADFLHKEKIK